MAGQVCTAPGCDRPVKAKGLCVTCYSRVRSWGSLEPPARDPDGKLPLDLRNVRPEKRALVVRLRALTESELAAWCDAVLAASTREPAA